MNMGNETEVMLPTNEADLDVFVASITEEFNLPPGDDTYDAIATMIMHLPHQKAYALRSHFGHGVMKSMANRAAYNKLRELAHKRDEALKAKEEEEKMKLSLVPEPDASSESQPIQNA